MNKILVIDDERVVRKAFAENLKHEGFFIVEASNGAEGLKVFQKEMPDAVLLDLKMPGLGGKEVLIELKKLDNEVPIIIVTAHGDVPTAVEAIKLGAYDLLIKPCDFDSLIITLKRAIEKLELERKVRRLTAGIESSLESLFGRSAAIKKVINKIDQVASSDLSVILQGETGTGKSYIANIIHNLSKRVDGPFVTVDLSAIPESLVESELFGYDQGAFTGAEKNRKGFFEAAEKGTVFLDDVQNISPYVQSKLLRVVEERKISRLGSTSQIEIDVRIIAATNADIKLAVKEKRFREDLFFRLGEFIITIPPFRDRVEDIPFIARKLCSEAASEMKKRVSEISDEAIDILKKHSWPGNIRELKNVVKRAVLLNEDGIIRPEHIAFMNAHGNDKNTPSQIVGVPLSLSDVERHAINHALEYTGGNKKKAAAILQIDYTTLHRKLKQYLISP